MRKSYKSLLTLGIAIGLSASFTLLSFAGWEQTGASWKYHNANGTYATGWNWIDGNGDGIAECYYFNADGSMLASTTTPDNYMVNEDGAWVVNGVVQTKPVESQHVSNGQVENNVENTTNQNQTNNTEADHPDWYVQWKDGTWHNPGDIDWDSYDDSEFGGVSGVQSEVRTY